MNIKSISLGICAILSSVPVFAANQMPEALTNLMPLPQQVALDEGALTLNAPFAIAVTPPTDAQTGNAHTDARVSQAIGRLRQLLAERTHHDICLSPCPKPVRLSVAWDKPSAAVQSVVDPESYTLDVTTQQASLHARGPLGVLRGLETLSQWLKTDAAGTHMAAVHISDAPRFAWRGLLLDSARHFMPPATVKRNLDAMATVKLNVLHWHLSDDQGFRVQSDIFPELTEKASNGEFYTKVEVRDIVHYAAQLGIRVVPELDMPGHTASWFVSHPELASDAGPHTPMAEWGIFDSALNPARESTYVFVDQLLGEMTALFPDAYFHLGGDEVSGVAWRNNPEIVAFMQAHQMADAHALQTYFINRVAAMANAYGKQVVGWDEILQPGLKEGTVIQSWRGPDGVRQSLDLGYQSLLSHGWYLSGSAAAHYLNDPATGLDTQKAHSPKLLGGEACLWSELVTPELVDASIWPRAAAVAERLWSDAQVRDVPDMYRRLAQQSERLVALGVNHRGYQERRLIELAGTPHVAPLQVLASVLESRRENWWPQFRNKRALDGFYDVLFAESDRARDLQAAANAVVTRPEDAAAGVVLGQELRALRDNGPAVEHLLDSAQALQGVRPVSALVVHLSQVGLQALEAVQAHQTLSDAWGREARAVLAEAQDDQLGLFVALAPAVAPLVEAASPNRAAGAQVVAPIPVAVGS